MTPHEIFTLLWIIALILSGIVLILWFMDIYNDLRKTESAVRNLLLDCKWEKSVRKQAEQSNVQMVATNIEQGKAMKALRAQAEKAHILLSMDTEHQNTNLVLEILRSIKDDQQFDPILASKSDTLIIANALDVQSLTNESTP